MNSGFKVEYSKDGKQVCIIPMPLITTVDFDLLVNYYIKQGYKNWLPADHRRGFIFEKEKQDED